MNNTQRPYKEDTPIRTVARIRHILAGCAIMPIEARWYRPYAHTHSVRLTTGSEYGSFGTNGKGLDAHHCLASAHAEFVERLQNDTFLFDTSRRNLIGLKEELGFHFYPDERLLEEDEFRALPPAIVDDMLPPDGAGPDDRIAAYYDGLRARGRQGCVAVPFTPLSSAGGQGLSGQPLYLPYDALAHASGSNGMTAGNTQDEALAVGLFEVLERWAAAEVFFKRLTPPTIPLACLDDLPAQQSIVAAMAADGYEVTIKDFTAGLGLPVVGVLAVDRHSGRHRLSVGSDSSFAVAVARCLTEAYQGVTDNAALVAVLSDLLAEDEQSPAAMQDEFSKYTRNHRGRFPASLLGAEPSYAIDPSPFSPQPTYRQELARWVGHLAALGRPVLVRDASFLGFPAYHIYVPGVSTVARESVSPTAGVDGDAGRRLEQAVDWMCSAGELTAEQWADIATAFDAQPPGTGLDQVLGLEFEAGSDLNAVSTDYFAAAIWYGLRRPERALAALDRYLAVTVQKPDSSAQLDYYLAVRTWVAGKASDLDDSGTEEELRRLGYAPALIDTVRADMHDPDVSIRDLPRPQCPQCHRCGLRSECVSGGHLDLARAVFPAYAAASPRLAM